MLNKPKGVISSLEDPEGRPTLSEFTKRIKERVYPVGRLDFNTDGLILLTNDGGLAERIQKDASILRFYHVKVKGHPNPEMLSRLKHRVKIGDEFLKAHLARPIARLQNKSVILLVVRGAGAFDVRAYFEEKGFLVERVTRIGIGHIGLKSMVPGEIKQLVESQVVALVNQPELAERLLERTNEVELTRPEDVSGFEGYEGSESTAVVAPRSLIRAKTDEPRVRSSRGPRRETPAPRFADRFNRSGQKTRESRSTRGPVPAVRPAGSAGPLRPKSADGSGGFKSARSVVMPVARAEGRGQGSFEGRDERRSARPSSRPPSRGGPKPRGGGSGIKVRPKSRG